MGTVLRADEGIGSYGMVFASGMTGFAGEAGRQLREHFSASMASTTIRAHRALSGSGTSMT